MILFGCLQSKIYTESGAAYTIACLLYTSCPLPEYFQDVLARLGTPIG